MNKIRILQVVGSLNRGGLETLLLNILRQIDRDRFQIDFLVQTDERGDLDEEIRDLGSQIIPVTGYKQLWSYAPKVKRVMGRYDVIHSHVYLNSGLFLRWAESLNINTRIAHGHTVLTGDMNPGLPRQMYVNVMKRLIRKYATHGLACSGQVAKWIFGDDWEKNRKWSVLRNGIDLAPFRLKVDRATMCRDWAIPGKAHVIGHVGSFYPQKNHDFIIKLFSEYLIRDVDARLLLAGDGPLRQEIESKVQGLGIGDKVRFAGLRNDVPELMMGLFDLLLLPSTREGFGIVVLEAQAAGLPCLVSDVVPQEAVIIDKLVHFKSLADSVNSWVDKMTRIKENPQSCESSYCLDLLSDSPCNIKNVTSRIEELYSQTV